VCLTHFKVLKRKERTEEETEENVIQKEVRGEGRRNVGSKWWTSDRIRAWRIEEKHKNQRKEIRKAGNQFAHMCCIPIVFRFLA
jgi:hypothetical protein